jgi:hypothetical protein
MTLENMTRDDLCIALADLYGYAPYEWDGWTMAELWQHLTDEQQTAVEEFIA